MKAYLKRLFGRDLARPLYLGGIAFAVLWLSEYRPLTSLGIEVGPLMTAIGVAVLLALASHITRRLLFHYLDLGDLAKKALENSIGAAIVFASVCYLLAVLINTSAALYAR